MSCENRFFYCKHCGNLVGLIHSSGVPMICCGEEMTELVPGSVDAAQEKHVPVPTKKCSKVTVAVGEVPHPMEENHYIDWIYLQTERGGQSKCLKPGEEPVAVFSLTDDKPVAVYAHCNLHGLWKADM